MQTGRPVARNYECINPLTRSRLVEDVIELVCSSRAIFQSAAWAVSNSSIRKISIGSRAPDPGAIRYVRDGKLLATAQQFCGQR